MSSKPVDKTSSISSKMVFFPDNLSCIVVVSAIVVVVVAAIAVECCNLVKKIGKGKQEVVLFFVALHCSSIIY